MLLDGFNNPGHSGAPAFTTGQDGKPSVAGIISGYRFELESHGGIFLRDADGNEEQVPDLYGKQTIGMVHCNGAGRLTELTAKATWFIPVRV